MNKQKRKKRGKKSVQNLLGLQGFTTYGLKTAGGELVYFAIQPTNISVLSDRKSTRLNSSHAT